MRRQVRDWEKIFATHISNIRLVSRIYKVFISFNMETNQTIKNGCGEKNSEMTQALV